MEDLCFIPLEKMCIFKKVMRQICHTCARIKKHCSCTPTQILANKRDPIHELHRCRCRFGCYCERARKARNLLSRISDADSADLGFPVSFSRPKLCIMTARPVPVPVPVPFPGPKTKSETVMKDQLSSQLHAGAKNV